jgi:hypothetical protein
MRYIITAVLIAGALLIGCVVIVVLGSDSDEEKKDKDKE